MILGSLNPRKIHREKIGHIFNIWGPTLDPATMCVPTSRAVSQCLFSRLVCADRATIRPPLPSPLPCTNTPIKISIAVYPTRRWGPGWSSWVHHGTPSPRVLLSIYDTKRRTGRGRSHSSTDSFMESTPCVFYLKLF